MIFLLYGYHQSHTITERFRTGTLVDETIPASNPPPPEHSTTTTTPAAVVPQASAAKPTKGQETIPKTSGVAPYDIAAGHREVFSVSTPDKKFFWIKLAHKKGINPNIIPHPYFNDTWIVVAMQHAPSSVVNSVWFAELVCSAKFIDNALQCEEPPQILPISATSGAAELCQPNLNFISLNIGPHDARVFYGPKAPYTIYGSNSQITCFGQWIQDFRLLVDWGLGGVPATNFRIATEMQRPKPYGMVEKNYFLFWDAAQLEQNETTPGYAHYDIWPKRAFAKIAWDGTSGPDLAPATAAKDEKCMKAYMPKVAKELESIHQATNSLRITLCKRADPTCIPTYQNTYIFTIFQHKFYYQMHSVYEPYVMLFKQSAPFEIHAISTRPIWISGRGTPGNWVKPKTSPIGEDVVATQTQMMYVTSVSWKERGSKYEGYVDDVLFLAFGIEDADTGGIDVLAGDLLQDLGLCIDI